MNEKDKKPHISASQLGMMGRCPEQYRRRYLENEIIPPGISMARGVGVHQGAKVNFKQKKDSHEDLPEQDIIDASVAGYEAILKRGIQLTEDEESRGYDAVVGETKDTVVGLAHLFAGEVAPQYQPVYVEERHRIVVPNATHDLVAIMDLADEFGRVVDLKTSGKSKSQRDVDGSEQLSFYALVFKALTGDLPSEVRLEVLVETPKTHKRSRQTLVGARTSGDLIALVNRINAMLKALEAGVFMPRTEGWWCDSRWCGYWRSCRFISEDQRRR